MTPALVVFDMIGTTVAGSDRVAQIFGDTTQAAGLVVTPDAIARVRGLNKEDAFMTLARAGGATGEAAQAVAAALFADFRARLAHDLATAPPREVPGAGATFRWLAARGVPVALISGLDREYVGEVLARLDWSDAIVTAVVCAGDVARGRPAPDLIHEAMRRAGVVEPSGVMAVGDTVADLEAAAAARVGAAIGVLSGAGSEAALRRAPHRALLASVAALPAWLDAQPG